MFLASLQNMFALIIGLKVTWLNNLFTMAPSRKYEVCLYHSWGNVCVIFLSTFSDRHAVLLKEIVVMPIGVLTSGILCPRVTINIFFAFCSCKNIQFYCLKQDTNPKAKLEILTFVNITSGLCHCKYKNFLGKMSILGISG